MPTLFGDWTVQDDELGAWFVHHLRARADALS
jgi:hypothetical protein